MVIFVGGNGLTAAIFAVATANDSGAAEMQALLRNTQAPCVCPGVQAVSTRLGQSAWEIFEYDYGERCGDYCYTATRAVPIRVFGM